MRPLAQTEENPPVSPDEVEVEFGDIIVHEPRKAGFGTGILVGGILGVVGTLFFATIATRR